MQLSFNWVSRSRFLAAYIDLNFMKCKIDPSDALAQDMNDVFVVTSSVSIFKSGQTASNSLKLCDKLEVDVDGWINITDCRP